MRSIVVVDVGVVETPGETTPKPLPIVVVVAGRDEPTMEGDCADAASVKKILLNSHSSLPILHLVKIEMEESVQVLDKQLYTRESR